MLLRVKRPIATRSDVVARCPLPRLVGRYANRFMSVKQSAACVILEGYGGGTRTPTFCSGVPYPHFLRAVTDVGRLGYYSTSQILDLDRFLEKERVKRGPGKGNGEDREGKRQIWYPHFVAKSDANGPLWFI